MAMAEDKRDYWPDCWMAKSGSMLEALKSSLEHTMTRWQKSYQGGPVLVTTERGLQNWSVSLGEQRLLRLRLDSCALIAMVLGAPPQPEFLARHATEVRIFVANLLVTLTGAIFSDNQEYVAEVSMQGKQLVPAEDKTEARLGPFLGPCQLQIAFSNRGLRRWLLSVKTSARVSHKRPPCRPPAISGAGDIARVRIGMSSIRINLNRLGAISVGELIATEHDIATPFSLSIEGINEAPFATAFIGQKNGKLAIKMELS